MIIDYVELCGFRGFRDKIRVNFGRGFTVISGRNGVGKSTLCDAVEFAIIGVIDKYAVEKAARESLSDYLWWRGEGVPESHYVTVSFLSDDGSEFTITRTRESGSDRSPDEIHRVLCRGPTPDNAVQQLARTSIIRDEWIAAMSLDLSDTERFDLVRSALGSAEGPELITKAREVVAAADAAHRHNETAYEASRSKLADRIVEQTEAQSALGSSGDVSEALQAVGSIVPNMLADLTSRLQAGRQALVNRRITLHNMDEALAIGRDIEAAQQQFNAPGAEFERRAAAEALEEAQRAKEIADNAIAQAQQLVAREEDADATAASLTLLVEHGERLGLHNEHCPLCAARRSSPEYAAGLEAARRRIASLASGVQRARDELALAIANARQPTEALAAAEARVRAYKEEEARLRAREQAHVEFYDRTGLSRAFINNSAGFGLEIAAERSRLIELERALLVLDASRFVSRVASIESSIASLRDDQEKLADVARKSQAALAAARDIERSVRRVGAEIVDERLAQISPLLNELYQRLRPHAEWKTIDYSIRGDVRRFLSLKVGAGLNPQFVFSSGQRRAAGLAFLLSVHLARAWTPLRTLLLDDPVQHIDDFRALQLVEVLAALRQDGRQIVCAVEDSSLADLLCRRLVSTPLQDGRRIDIDIGPEGWASILTEKDVPPMPSGVLRRNSNLKVVGEA